MSGSFNVFDALGNLIGVITAPAEEGCDLGCLLLIIVIPFIILSFPIFFPFYLAHIADSNDRDGECLFWCMVGVIWLCSWPFVALWIVKISGLK